MQPVLDTDGIRNADRHTIEDLGVPGMVLMENASTGVVEALRQEFPEARRVLVLCGSGNNGGDGLAASRHLLNGGHQVEVVVFAAPEKLTGDAAKNLELARAFGVPLTHVSGDDLEPTLERIRDSRVDVIVDAMLGTGLDRPLGGRLLTVAETINAVSTPVLAVDVPSGLNGASAEPPGTAVQAHLTTTFGALKVCHVLPPACHLCGQTAVVEIGIPPRITQAEAWGWWIEAEDAALWLPVRPVSGHKGTFGHLLIVAGAAGRAGAVSMAAHAAVVGGVGLVTAAVPAPAAPVVDGACREAMVHSLPAEDDGTVAGPEGLEIALEKKTAIAAGPGMGTGDGARRTLDWILETWNGPLLLDADAVNLLAGSPGRLAGREVPPVLTPHPGELARLLGRETAEVVADRAGAAGEAARLAEAVVVAKSYRTIIASPAGELWINPTGDAHLASGGAGDVLTGLIGGFLAQGLDPQRAAGLGTWLHGRAGELGADNRPAATPASELPEHIAEAWHELERPE